MTEHTVRDLNVEDMMNAADIVDSLVSNIEKGELDKIMSGSGDAKEIGISIIKAAIKHARVPAFEFLASVNEMSVDEFKKKPAIFITGTVKAILENPSNKGFFEELRSFLPSA